VKRDELHQRFVELLYSLSPQERFIPLFEAIVRDVWKAKQADHEQAASLISKRIASMEARKQRLIESVVDGRIDKATYDDQIGRVGTDLAAAQGQLSQTLIGAEELDCLLEFAAWLLERVAGIWNSAAAPNKRRIQTALFPAGLTLTKEGFGTAQRPLFFNQFQAIPVEGNGMASQGDSNPLTLPFPRRPKFDRRP
jgi:hypothetical protein